MLKCCRHSRTAHSWFHVLWFRILYLACCRWVGKNAKSVQYLWWQLYDHEGTELKLWTGFEPGLSSPPSSTGVTTGEDRVGGTGQYAFLFCFFWGGGQIPRYKTKHSSSDCLSGAGMITQIKTGSSTPGRPTNPTETEKGQLRKWGQRLCLGLGNGVELYLRSHFGLPCCREFGKRPRVSLSKGKREHPLERQRPRV